MTQGQGFFKQISPLFFCHILNSKFLCKSIFVSSNASDAVGLRLSVSTIYRSISDKNFEGTIIQKSGAKFLHKTSFDLKFFSHWNVTENENEDLTDRSKFFFPLVKMTLGGTWLVPFELQRIYMPWCVSVLWIGTAAGYIIAFQWPVRYPALIRLISPVNQPVVTDECDRSNLRGLWRGLSVNAVLHKCVVRLRFNY